MPRPSSATVTATVSACSAQVTRTGVSVPDLAALLTRLYSRSKIKSSSPCTAASVSGSISGVARQAVCSRENTCRSGTSVKISGTSDNSRSCNSLRDRLSSRRPS